MSTSYPYNEKALFLRIAEGDEDAFNELYFHLQPVLLGFTIKLLKSDDAVMEVLQESLLRFWLQRDKLAEIEHPRSYLFKIVSNECFRHFQKKGLEQKRNTLLNDHFNKEGVSHVTEMDLSYRETQRFIENAVEALSPRQREIYRLSRNHGLRIPEIAQELGLSEVYVKKTLMLALSIIRQKLIDAGRYTVPLLLFLLK